MIPQIINGVSANSLFWLCYAKENQSFNKFIGNNETSSLDIPYDIDDFGRCVNMVYAFNLTQKDIDAGVKNAKEYELPEYFIKFIENLLPLCELFRIGNIKEWLVKMQEIMEKNGFWRNEQLDSCQKFYNRYYTIKDAK